MPITTDPGCKHYKANEDLIILKDGLISRKYLGETGHVNFYQFIFPKQLVSEVLRSLHGELGKHPGITETNIAYRRKKCFLKLAHLINEWVMRCDQCIRETRIDRSSSHPPLQNRNKLTTAPEHAMQIASVPELSPSSGYEIIVTSMDVFSLLLLAYPTFYQDAKTIVKVFLTSVLSTTTYQRQSSQTKAQPLFLS